MHFLPVDDFQQVGCDRLSRQCTLHFARPTYDLDPNLGILPKPSTRRCARAPVPRT